MRCLLFIAEPTGATYEALVDFCCALSSRMIFVVRDTHPNIEAALDVLRPDLISIERVRRWPGTELLYGGEATAYRHRVTPHLRSVLKAQVTSLFEWNGFLPEDPCFFRDDETVLLTTISHEKEAYLVLSDEEWMALSRDYSALALLLRDEADAAMSS